MKIIKSINSKRTEIKFAPARYTGETLFRREKGSPPDPLPKTAEFDLPVPIRRRASAEINAAQWLQDNADKAVAAVVYDALDSFLHLLAGIGRHTIKLVLQSLVDKLVQRLAENI